MSTRQAGGAGRGSAAGAAPRTHEEDLRHAFSESLGGQRLPQRLGLEAPAGAVAQQRVAATVLFADIRDFTSLAEKLDPAEVSELLTQFFQCIAPVVLRHGGRHLRFVGDALVAVFPAGSPAPIPPARQAIAAALAVALAAHEFRSWLATRFAGHGLPVFAIGIGLHAGEVTISRSDGAPGETSASGECIETAARLQAASKELGWTVVASQRVLHQAGRGVQTWGMTSLQVRGPRDWVDGAEIVGLEAGPADRDDGGIEAIAQRGPEIAEALRVNSEITARAVKGALHGRLSTLKGHRFAPGDAPLRLKGFRLTRKLGAGGMGEVYLGVRERDGLPVVLKVVQAVPPLTTRALSRFVQECALLSGIDDPHVVRIYGQGFGADHAYLAMEYLEGGDLRGELRAGMGRPRALQVLAQLAQALQAIHARGIVHRDLKPENVLRGAGGRVVLADFGIASMVPPQDAPPSARPGRGGIGTPYYLSPEQASGGPVGASSDLYSLGVLLYEMLSGQRPYGADSLDELLQRHLRAPVPRLPPAHQDLQPVLDRLMAKRPQDRYPGARALLDDLDARGLSRNEPSRPRGQGPTPTIDR